MSDLEATIEDLISGQYNKVRVVSFNTVEGWSHDVSEDIAGEIQCRYDLMGEDVPCTVQNFVETFMGATRQLTLRLIS